MEEEEMRNLRIKALIDPRRALVVCIGMVALLLPAGAGLAAIPGPDGVISGCYDSALLSLRVRDVDLPETACTASETPLNWNQLGPPGPKATPEPQAPRAPRDRPVHPVVPT
jgi:hypothetical protein